MGLPKCYYYLDRKVFFNKIYKYQENNKNFFMMLLMALSEDICRLRLLGEDKKIIEIFSERDSCSRVEGILDDLEMPYEFESKRIIGKKIVTFKE